MSRVQVENLDLPPTLLSRFDLIYLILDKPNADNDRRLARHIVSLCARVARISCVADTVRRARYWRDAPPQADVLPVELMTRYISYARRHSHPRITAEAASALVARYVQMRRAGVSQACQHVCAICVTIAFA
jgi:DNA replication licensing factor MCM4